MLHEKPIAVRCSPEMRANLERRAKAAGVKTSVVVRELLEVGLEASSRGGLSATPASDAKLDEVLLMLSALQRLLLDVAGRQRTGVDAILQSIAPDDSADLREWLDLKFPVLGGDGEAA